MQRTVAGHDVWVTQRGEGAQRLFIHCSFSDARSLVPLAQALPPARDILFDLPGHGRSGPWTGQDYHGDASDIACALASEETHVIGHSFGATVALRMAVEAPHLVSRLTLIEPVMFAAARGAPAHARHRTTFQPFFDAIDRGDLEAAAAVFVGMWGGDAPWADLPRKVRDRITGQIHLVPAAASVIEDDVLGLVDRLGRIRCPVDLIEASASQPIMPAIMDGLQSRIPHARRHLVAGAGHMVPMTHIADVAAAILG